MRATRSLISNFRLLGWFSDFIFLGNLLEIEEDKITDLIREHFDLRPKNLIKMLDLKRPIYQATAAYGHFGREEEAFSWEKTDKKEALKSDL